MDRLVEGRFPVVGKQELAQRRQEMAVGLKPRHIAVVQTEGWEASVRDLPGPVRPFGRDEVESRHRKEQGAHRFPRRAFVVPVEVEPHERDPERKLELSRRDAAERPLGLGQIGHERLKDGAKAVVSDRLGRRVLRDRHTQERHAPAQGLSDRIAVGRREAVAVQPLPQPLDGIEEPDKSQREACLSIPGRRGKPRFGKGFRLGQPCLGQERLVARGEVVLRRCRARPGHRGSDGNRAPPPQWHPASPSPRQEDHRARALTSR